MRNTGTIYDSSEQMTVWAHEEFNRRTHRGQCLKVEAFAEDHRRGFRLAIHLADGRILDWPRRPNRPFQVNRRGADDHEAYVRECVRELPDELLR